MEVRHKLQEIHYRAACCVSIKSEIKHWKLLSILKAQPSDQDMRKQKQTKQPLTTILTGNKTFQSTQMFSLKKDFSVQTKLHRTEKSYVIYHMDCKVPAEHV